jgi:hypothetical protein
MDIAQRLSETGNHVRRRELVHGQTVSVCEKARHEVTVGLSEQQDLWCDTSALCHSDGGLFSPAIDAEYRRVIAPDPNHELGFACTDKVVRVREPAGQDLDREVTRSCEFGNLGNDTLELGYVCWQHHGGRCYSLAHSGGCDNRCMEYEHTQYGYTGILTTIFVVVVAAMALPSAFEESQWSGLLFVVFMVGLVALTFWFSRLIVTVEDGEVTATFGIRKPHMVNQLSNVRTVTQVRNTWIQGWGVRKTSDGWMYNVWGLDAVELELGSGHVFRIGTDEPEQLHTAISLSLPG